MSEIYRIRTYGEEVLRKECREIEGITDEVREFTENLVESMYKNDGVGLAAPQVGKLWSIIAVDTHQTDGRDYPIVLINPEVVESEGNTEFEEGCLSIPGVFKNISRPQYAKIKGIDVNGNEVNIEDDGILSRVLQHEIDHLKGVLFIDYLNTLSKLSISRKLKKLKQSHD